MNKRLNKRFKSASAVKEAIQNNRFRQLRLTLFFATFIIAISLAGAFVFKKFRQNPAVEAPEQTETSPAAVPAVVIPPTNISQTEVSNPKPEKATTKKVDISDTEKINAKEVEELFNAASESIL